MDKLAEQFAVVTGASKEVGLRLLEVTDGNLEMAVTMQIDGLDPGAVTNGRGDSRPGAPDVVDLSGDAGEEIVRPPDPRKWDILNPEPLIVVPPRRKPRGGRSSVFDPFRDFEAETRQQEEMLRTGQVASSSKTKRKTLEDLFRPPIDLMFSGSFHAVREQGQNIGKWLMVNIQNMQEFSCQKLNRDVWSDQTVKSIVKESFIFWQVFHDSEDGLKYTQFYDVTEYPYVAVLDPRTGELLATWHHLDTLAFCDLAMEFLTNHPCFDAATGLSPPSKKPRKESIIDLDEDHQLKAAIDASLAESSSSESQNSPQKKAIDSKNNQKGAKNHPKSDTTVRLSDRKPNATVNEADSDSEISILSDDGFSFSDSDSEKPVRLEQEKTSVRKTTDGSPVNGGGGGKTNVSLVDITGSVDESSSKNRTSGIDDSVVDITESIDASGVARLESHSIMDDSVVEISGPANRTNSGVRARRVADQSVIDITGDTTLGDSTLGDTSLVDTTFGDTSLEDTTFGDTTLGDTTLEEEDRERTRVIMLRYPDGRRKEAKFRPLDTLRDLQMHVMREGFSPESYELVTTFPLRRLCLIPIDTALRDAKISSREMIYIQER